MSDIPARPDVVSWTHRDDPVAYKRLAALLMRPAPAAEQEKPT